ncbi:ABC transporter ATP-binding protein [Bacillus sonorensis]|uniref:ABC transporter ATP-binding protein n=1 Tax=Bacillus sonorensis TaxID=119858 RepID=UPI000495A3AA|nr:ATP-binding cassette domain-containing protein [Bacillus sonorensis]MEC1592069.1 ATP-binding cassette domain-containing protein [Bacillus sonorensis]
MIIETKGVTKTYNRIDVVKDAGLLVPEGEVYGFLGPNGSGKTTMMRMLMGLIRPDSGEILVFGNRMPDNRISILAKTGALIEKPSYYEHLDGRDNLRILATLRGISDNRAIDWALERVGLHRVGSKKVKSYSLGMKQRQGIASAILHNPRLLLLDEPTNGLDPEGIHEIRELIRELPKKEGATVLVSSHLLGEVEQMANRIGVIYHGNLLFQGEMATLLSDQKSSCIIRSTESGKIIDILREHGLETRIDRAEQVQVSGAVKDKIEGILIENEITDFHINESPGTLEEAYLQLIRSSEVSV